MENRCVQNVVVSDDLGVLLYELETEINRAENISFNWEENQNRLNRLKIITEKLNKFSVNKISLKTKIQNLMDEALKIQVILRRDLGLLE